MLPLWLVDTNYYIACTAGFVGNLLVIIFSMKTGAQEIRAYRWIISIEAAVEAIACVLKLIIELVCFRNFILIFYRQDSNAMKSIF